MITWDRRYTTCDNKIDEQHKRLFDFTNQIEESLSEGKAEASVLDALNYLMDYARMHFQYEEHCMDVRKCPFARRNEQAHQQFLDTVVTMCKKHRTNEVTLRDIHIFLETWITRHILTIDTHLK
jgi:hemerythrin